MNCSSEIETQFSRVGENNTKSIPSSCECAQEWKSYEYTPLISMSEWPSESYVNVMAINPMDPETRVQYWPVVERFVEHSLIKKDDYVKRNMAEVQVYMHSNQVEVVKEEPDYDFKSLMSDLGGVIGLYIGMAVVGLVELLEFFIMVVYVLCTGESQQTPKEQTKIKEDLDTNGNSMAHMHKRLQLLEREMVSLHLLMTEKSRNGIARRAPLY